MSILTTAIHRHCFDIFYTLKVHVSWFWKQRHQILSSHRENQTYVWKIVNLLFLLHTLRSHNRLGMWKPTIYRRRDHQGGHRIAQEYLQVSRNVIALTVDSSCHLVSDTNLQGNQMGDHRSSKRNLQTYQRNYNTPAKAMINTESNLCSMCSFSARIYSSV